jgi:hypothetical protein
MTNAAASAPNIRSGRRPASALTVLVALAPVGLVVIAEAAWISVIAGLIQEYALHDAVFSIATLAVWVAAGIAVARWLGPRSGRRWPAVAFALVAVSGAIGWLSSPDARAALADGLGPALAAHPGGWLAGIALLRGFAHARIPLAEGTVANLLGIGVPGLALAAALGGLIVDPWRTRFLADATASTIVYVITAVLALALTRLDAIGIDAGFDWRRNPPWLVLTVVLLGVAILVAIPLASIAGTLIAILVSIALGPLLIVGLVTGFDGAARRIIAFFLVVTVVISVLLRIFGGRSISVPPVTPEVPTQAPPSAAEQVFTMGLGGLLLLGAIAGIIVMIAVWMRRAPAHEVEFDETRSIDPSDAGLSTGRSRRSRFGFRAAPVTAVEAYVALVGDLERHADVRREPAETPAAHAARLRANGRSGLSLDLLAADYALARYGGVELPGREDRRAVARWRVLRRRIAIRPAGIASPGGSGRSGEAPRPDAERPVDIEPRRTF